MAVFSRPARWNHQDATELNCGASGKAHPNSIRLRHELPTHFLITTNSVRRFFARPSSVSLEAMGLSAP